MGAVEGGPNVVNSGLVLCLDAANNKSYPGSGTTWTDLSPNQNNGILTNGPTFNTGSGGNIVCDGIDDYVKPPSSSTLQLTDFTLSSWVKTTIANTNQFIIDCSSNAALGFGYSYRITSSNTIRFWAYSAQYYLDSISTLSTNTWYNIVVTYDNSTLTQKIYINNVLDNSSTAGYFITSTPSYLQIGAAQLFGMYLKGNISSIQIHNRTLSASEITQNYNAIKGRFGL